MSKFFDEFEAFRTGCQFSDCADFIQKQTQNDPLSGSYPVIINASFACEVFLKLLLHFSGLSVEKTHNLKDLFKKLPTDMQSEIKQAMLLQYGYWCDVWNFEYLDNISNAFVTWRYMYEHDWSKSASMQIETGFLFALKDALKEKCCKRITVVEYKV